MRLHFDGRPEDELQGELSPDEKEILRRLERRPRRLPAELASLHSVAAHALAGLAQLKPKTSAPR